ncbi:DUF3179 domain-containing protein [Candidatus Pacebacteria bacterium]|nr:DUF3179 domain-containing protein [Candidatus Paceibacterota bacterium]
MNEFDLTDTLVPVAEILSGGPPKDGIPSIDKPTFTNAAEAAYADDDMILGVVHNGVAKAYPISIMNWHEIVNDDFGGVPVAVTYCPLCGSGIAYKATLQGKRTEFGVSGLLYNSDVLLYDRNTNSLWSQIMNTAIAGPSKGDKLTPLTTQNSTLSAWKKLHPDTLVLTTETGFDRDYDRNPYSGYDTSDAQFFPVAHEDTRLAKKDWVIGIEHDGATKAYPRKTLMALGEQSLEDTIGGSTITLSWDEEVQSVTVLDVEGVEIPNFTLFWFAWAAFHPDTDVFVAPSV